MTTIELATAPDHTRRRRRYPSPIAAAAGGAAGALAQVADGHQHLSELGSRAGVWVVAIVLLGAAAPTHGRAWRAATAFSVASLIGYYLMGTIDSGWAPPWNTVAFWTLAALTVVPVLAVVSHWSWRSGHPGAVLVGGLVSGGLLAEAITIALADSIDRWWALTFDLVAGLAIAAGLVWRSRRPGHVVAAAAAGVGIGLVAIELVDELYRRVI